MTDGLATGKDARRSERARTLLGARALLNNGRSVIDCQIRNISDTGARLSLSDALILPAQFALEIPAQNRTRNVVLRWRNQMAAGVQFAEAAPADSAAPSCASDELDALRQENARLRRRLADMMRRLSELGFSDADI